MVESREDAENGEEGSVVVADDTMEDDEEEDELVRDDTEDLLSRTPWKSGNEKMQTKDAASGSAERQSRGNLMLQVVITPGKSLSLMEENGSGTFVSMQVCELLWRKFPDKYGVYVSVRLFY